MKKIRFWLGVGILGGLFPGVYSMMGVQVGTSKVDRLSVRGQATTQSEVLTKLRKSESVRIVEIIALKPKTKGEPIRWAKILLPENTPVWVYADFIDPAGKTVTVPKLNVRGGPGEKYSIVGRLNENDHVIEIRRAGKWIEIEPPEDAYAYVAADFLEIRELPEVTPLPVKAGLDMATDPPEQPEHTDPPEQADPKTIEPVFPAEPATEASSGSGYIGDRPNPAENSVDPPESQSGIFDVEVTQTVEDRNRESKTGKDPTGVKKGPRRRIVSREGIIKRTISIQAPTKYRLQSSRSNFSINYLQPDIPKLQLRDFRGKKVLVTGEELLDQRWKKTPI